MKSPLGKPDSGIEFPEELPCGPKSEPAPRPRKKRGVSRDRRAVTAGPRSRARDAWRARMNPCCAASVSTSPPHCAGPIRLLHEDEDFSALFDERGHGTADAQPTPWPGAPRAPLPADAPAHPRRPPQLRHADPIPTPLSARLRARRRRSNCTMPGTRLIPHRTLSRWPYRSAAIDAESAKTHPRPPVG